MIIIYLQSTCQKISHSDFFFSIFFDFLFVLFSLGFDSGNGNENDPHLLNRKISSIAISKQKSFLPDQKYSGKSKSHLLSIYQK